MILLYKKWTILAKNSIYFSYYEHIKVHLYGFIVQTILETNEIDQIKTIYSCLIWPQTRKKAKNYGFLALFHKNAIFSERDFGTFLKRKLKNLKDRCL